MHQCKEAFGIPPAEGHWIDDAVPNEAGRTILIVDRDTRQREQLSLSFRSRGHTVVTRDGFDGVARVVATGNFDLLITEAVLGDDSAVTMIGAVRRMSPSVSIVVLTTFASVSMAVRHMRAGASLFAVKPRTADEILVEFEHGGPARQPVEHPSYHRAVWEYLQQCVSSAGSLSEASRRLRLERRSLRRMLQKTPPVR